MLAARSGIETILPYGRPDVDRLPCRSPFFRGSKMLAGIEFLNSIDPYQLTDIEVLLTMADGSIEWRSDSF